MSELTYTVVFEGDILPGNTKVAVQERLARVFNIQKIVVAALFAGKQREIKHGVTLEQAKKYIRAMAKLGALAFMIPQDLKDTVVSVHDEDEFTETGSFEVGALSSHKIKAVIPPVAVGHESDDRDDTTVPNDAVGALSSNAFSSFFERKQDELDKDQLENDGAHAIITEPGIQFEKQDVTDNKNVIDMHRLARMVMGK